MMASSTLSKAKAKSISNDNKGSISSNNNINLRERLCSRSDLKSSIPKPMPPRSRTSVHSSASQIILSRPLQQSKIPKLVFQSSNQENTRLSLQATPKSGKCESRRNQTKCRKQRNTSHARPRSLTFVALGKGAGAYSNVKAKVNTRPPTITKLKSQFCPLNVRLEVTPDSSVTDDNLETNDRNRKLEENVLRDEVDEKQIQVLKMSTELIKLQSPEETLEKEICPLMENKTSDHIGILVENLSILRKGSPEFLSRFEKQMHEVLDLWLRLIGEVTNTLITENPDMANITLSTDALNMRDELNHLFTSLPSRGESLQNKLQEIEKELSRAITGVIHNCIALFEKNEKLKGSYSRLEQTQNQVHLELKEQITTLEEKNELLVKKYKNIVEKYSMEISVTERLEKERITMNKETVYLINKTKLLEAKCNEFEVKTMKGETTCRSLENLIRNKGVIFMKVNKNHRDLQNKFNNLKDAMKALQTQLSDCSQAKAALENENRNLKEELDMRKAEMAALEEKVNEADQELTFKNKNVNDIQKKLDEIKAHLSKSICGVIGTKSTGDISPKVLIDDLVKANDLKTLQIQELGKKLITMENILQEKSTKEEDLLAKVADLEKLSFEKEGLLNQQILELKVELKGVLDAKDKFEKLAAQKNLEIDQRDLLVKEHAHVMLTTDELIPMLQSQQHNGKDYIEKLSALGIEQHKKTYFNQGDGSGIDDKSNTREMVDVLEKRFYLDPEMVNQELSFRQEKMCELYDLVEHKQMEMLRLKQRMKQLHGAREEEGRDKEAHVSLFMRKLEGRKNGMSRGKKFYVLFLRNKNKSKHGIKKINVNKLK